MQREAIDLLVGIDSIGSLHPLPIDSLWGSHSLVLSNQLLPLGSDTSSLLFSLVALFYMALLLFSYNSICRTLPPLFRSLFNFNFQRNIESKLSFVRTRGEIALLSLFTLSLELPLLFERHFLINFALSKALLFIYVSLLLLLYLLLKSSLLKYLQWVLKRREPFIAIGRAGFNHIILFTVASVPLIILYIVGVEIRESTIFNYLLICALPLFILYLITVFHLLREGKFSPIFNILYLCVFELAPPIVIVKLLFSYSIV
ncbi:MAG: DUF4271 domain-containing protein [Bacteroidales bacterium]